MQCFIYQFNSYVENDELKYIWLLPLDCLLVELITCLIVFCVFYEALWISTLLKGACYDPRPHKCFYHLSLFQ